MTAPSLLEEFPYLASPAALAFHHMEGRFVLARHHRLINDELVNAALNPGSRLIINCQFQVGKTLLSSKYYPAWRLLWNPDCHIILTAADEGLAAEQGGFVRDLIERYGAELGLSISSTSKAKDEWKIEGHEGGMLCRGPAGSTVGRASDEYVIDDLCKNATDALSPTVMQMHRNFYDTVVYGRLRKNTNVTIVTTRWSKNDIVGHVLKKAKLTGEVWRHVRLAALALDNDPLGRKKGEPLWPEQIPLKHVLGAQATLGRWWHANWQQAPLEEEGLYFHPLSWPRFMDLGNLYSVEGETEGAARKLFQKQDCIRLMVSDWAFSTKSGADRTGIGVWDIFPDGRLGLLDVFNGRLALHEFAPQLDVMCRQWRPGIVAVEQGHPTAQREVRNYPNIPEVRWLPTGNKNKIQRALPAMNYDGNRRLCLPHKPQHWHDEYVDQITSFTGADDDADDLVDMTSHTCNLAQLLRGTRGSSPEFGACQLTEGKQVF